MSILSASLRSVIWMARSICPLLTTRVGMNLDSIWVWSRPFLFSFTTYGIGNVSVLFTLRLGGILFLPTIYELWGWGYGKLDRLAYLVSFIFSYMFFFNYVCPVIFFALLSTRSFSGTHITCRIAVRYGDFGQTLYFDTLSLWLRLPSGKLFCCWESNGQRGTWNITALGFQIIYVITIHLLQSFLFSCSLLHSHLLEQNRKIA